jgi:hemolysin activation/secretion protein
MPYMSRSDRSRPARTRSGAFALATLAGLSSVVVAQVTPVEKNPPPGQVIVPSPPPTPPKPPPPPPAEGAPGPGEATLAILDAHIYDISAFVFRYAVEHADMPPLDEILGLEVALGQRPDGVFVSPRAGVQTVTLSLGDLASAQRAQRRYAGSAINAIATRVVEFFNQRGLVGVAVLPSAGQIDPRTLDDKRPPEQRTLVMDIWVRTVKEVRTLGAGPRWSKPTANNNRPSLETRVNHPYHERIRENSPVQPGDLLRKGEVEDYISRLERYGNRRIDATVASGETPGDVTLDYVITENRPWTAYFQLSNTGTKETNEWRERFGFVDYELTNRDDILSIDYITAGFTDVNAVVASYEAPLFGSPITRWKAYGTASRYTASDVGFSGENFKGDSWTAGGELITNILQVHRSFLDAFGGARWEEVHVRNTAAELQGRDDFFIPYAGLRFQRDTYRSSTSAEARIEGNLPSLAETSSDLNALGRLGADRNWTVFRWSAGHSFYLEPLIFRRDWSNPDAPYRHTTLAHEIAVAFRGQYAFGHTLIPQEEDTAGGLYTVRGYPESIVAGDNAYIFSGEYRYHVPRALQPAPASSVMGRPFRFRPDQRYSRPDWDLILRGFVDVGRVTGEDLHSETLAGTGVGAEIVVMRNLSLRLDWGIALNDVRETKSGDSRLHFVGTILY